jgi:hypothetical protein
MGWIFGGIVVFMLGDVFRWTRIYTEIQATAIDEYGAFGEHCAQEGHGCVDGQVGQWFDHVE